MLKIRLRRMGNRHRPFYRVVVSDGRKTPTSAALEEIGTYDPATKPTHLRLDVERADYWVKQGARPSDTVKRLIRRARNYDPEVEARKAAEKEAAEKAAAEQAAAEKAAAEKAAAEEAAAEKAAAEAEAAEKEAAENTEAEAETGAEEPAAEEAQAAAAEEASDEEAAGEKTDAAEESETDAEKEG